MFTGRTCQVIGFAKSGILNNKIVEWTVHIVLFFSPSKLVLIVKKNMVTGSHFHRNKDHRKATYMPMIP